MNSTPNHSTFTIEVEEIKGKLFPVFYMDQNGELLCKFCGKNHKHNGEGHRHAHCVGTYRQKIYSTDGIEFLQEHGYVVKKFEKKDDF